MELTIGHFTVSRWAPFQPEKELANPNRVSIQPSLKFKKPPADSTSLLSIKKSMTTNGVVKGPRHRGAHTLEAPMDGAPMQCTGACHSCLHLAPHTEPGQVRTEGRLLISVLTPRVMSVSVNKGRKGKLSQCWATRHREEQIATCILQDKRGRRMAEQE